MGAAIQGGVLQDVYKRQVEALSGSGAAVCYVTPSHQFPTGVTMPAGRRTEPVSYTHLDVYKRQAFWFLKMEKAR